MIRMLLDARPAMHMISVIGAVVDEFRMNISNDGWHVIAVDPTMVTIIRMNYLSEVFHEYECDSEIKVGIDIGTMKSFFPMLSDTPVIVLQGDSEPVEFIFRLADDRYQPPSEKNRYQVDIRQGIFSRSILLMPDKEIRKEVKVPIFNYSYTILLKTHELMSIIRRASDVSEYVKFQVQETEITPPGLYNDPELSIIAIDDNDMPFTAKPHAKFLKSPAEGKGKLTRSLFSIDYLRDFVKCIPASEIVMNIGNDLPVSISFEMPSTKGAYRFEYLQAPRVDSE